MQNKRIGIITITNGYNYGNRLQNLAMQLLVKEEFSTVETINNNLTIKSNIKYREYLLKKNIKTLLKGKTNDQIAFDRFNKKYINKSKYILLKDNSKDEINKYYDAFVIGSDQIWNPNYEENDSNTFAMFSDKPKIALAPSIGTKDIKENKLKLFVEYMNNLDYCSLREEYSSIQFSKYTNSKVDFLLDPTLMISRDIWIKYENKVDIDSNYILLYFLGDIPTSVSNYVKYLTEGTDIKIINLNELRKSNPIGPSEFIYLIRNARLVITDSYHGSIFSYIFTRLLLITKRNKEGESMYIRMESLINTLSLENNIFNENNLIELKDLKPCNYNEDIINKFKSIYKDKIKLLGTLVK